MLFVVLGLLGMAVAVSSISRAPESSGTLLDDTGNPVEGAYIAYFHRGYRFNFVDSITYRRPGAIIRTDAAGAYRIDGFWHVHLPLDRKLTPWIDVVYSPRLHHAFGPLVPGKTVISGRVASDDARQATVISDLSGDPWQWYRSMQQVSILIRDLEPGTTRQVRYSAPLAIRQALALHLLQEYADFMARYAETPRGAVKPSGGNASLWGPFMQRMWRRELATLKQITSAGQN